MTQFYPWFKFYFPLFQTHYYTLQYPGVKENKILTKDKIKQQYNHLHTTIQASPPGRWLQTSLLRK